MTYDNYIKYKNENAKLRRLYRNEKRIFRQKFLSEISPQTSLTEDWSKIHWITSKAKKRKKRIVFNNKKETKNFLNLNFPDASINESNSINSLNGNEDFEDDVMSCINVSDLEDLLKVNTRS